MSKHMGRSVVIQSLIWLCLMVWTARVGPLYAQDVRLEVLLEAESTVVPGGNFPFMFRSRQGTLVVNGYVCRFPTGARIRPAWNRPISGPGVPLTVRSTDDGETWQIWAPEKGIRVTPAAAPKLAEVCDHLYCSGCVGPASQGSMIELRNGTILIYDKEPEPLFTEGKYGIEGKPRGGWFAGRMWRSRDDWKTVAGPEETYLHVPGAKPTQIGDHNSVIVGVIFFRSVIELPDGALLATMYGSFEADTVASEFSGGQAPDMKKFRSFLVRSEDQGRKWTYLSNIAVGNVGQEGFAEPCMIRLTGGRHPGRLICLMRTGRNNPLYQAVSDDDGQTWSEPRELELVGVAPSLIEMTDGVLAVSFGHKPAVKDDGNFLAFSLDQGETWGHVTRVSSGVTGAYTTVREIRPGELFVVYDEREEYYGSPCKRILGRKARVRKL